MVSRKAKALALRKARGLRRLKLQETLCVWGFQLKPLPMQQGWIKRILKWSEQQILLRINAFILLVVHFHYLLTQHIAAPKRYTLQ